MNTYEYHVKAIPEDTYHRFLQDKQAWENAIALYQGQDPLDHWYDFICWYESNRTRDAEDRFRESLERCLRLFEPIDFYKPDQRIARLWIKYIAMTPNPIHYYDALYHKGVGKQWSCFYIGWANCYQSTGQYKEAEEVFNRAFQNHAQPFAELQAAFTKLQYAKSNMTVLQQTIHHPVVEIPVQQSQPQRVQHFATAPQQLPCAGSQLQHIQQNIQSHQQPAQSAYTSAAYVQHAQAPIPQQQLHLSAQSAHYESASRVEPVQNVTEVQPAEVATTKQEVYYTKPTSYRVTALNSENATQYAIIANPAPKLSHNDSLSNSEEDTSCIFEYPRKFSNCSRNNELETRRPALLLEEPEDPNRFCFYAKSLLYPGDDYECTMEELSATKYLVGSQFVDENKALHPDNVSKNSEVCQEEVNNIETNNVHNNRIQVNRDFVEDGDEYYEDDNSYDDESDGDADSNEDNGQINDHNSTVHGEVVHTVDDLEDQIVASTIRFSTHTAQGVQQNKTIKIKFRKEIQKVEGNSNGCNYSAYNIDSVYKEQEQKPLTPRSNGYSFHPYVVGQTSTPKSSVKRFKSKIKTIGKVYAVINNNNSNSSSAAENGIYGEKSDDVNGENVVQNASCNDNANYSFSSASALDNSNSFVTCAIGRLNFRDNTATSVPDYSTYQENSYFATQHDDEAKQRRLHKAFETIDRHLSKEAVDPFNSELCRAFLTKLDFPGTEDQNANYKIIQTPLPKMQNTRTLTLPDGAVFNIDKEVGRGSYGSVYRATESHTNAVVALKYQKPPNTWEIYICDQVLKRVKSTHVLPGFMDISSAVIAPNASIIATEFSPFGSLLDINNKIRQATTKVMHESLVMHFSSQICDIVQHLHQNKIIHADIKPDNFLLMRVPSTELYCPSLRLIDFGCAIDLTLFPEPETTKFRKVIQTDGFTCVEMQEGRPWSYETDLFCVAGTVHVMLFGEYMQIQNRSGAWDIKQKLPRYLKKDVWSKFFGDMLNIQPNELPDLDDMREVFDEEAAKMDSELQKNIRTLSNILHRR